ncbi:sugar ABC transporter permease [Brachybacterium sp. P6-10-X1]|uniref:carbohydrate ABC transporter permease n=1 Tax=Brachybacterium sp. P6-10-X1 TaxID=1903186 RepID=UPI000971956A|nr:carbohydrate ABC transporter permease [Brachybacterium sp. P6-10-X1]APX33254.1 sugar ABC transporter permease [Brachybacterium sp. P6-10-X1]
MATIETRPSRRAGVSGAAPAPRMRASGKTFTTVTGIILVVLAIMWLIPSLFAIKTSVTDNGVAALGAQEILTDVSPTLESYLGLMRQGDIWNWYLSSFLTSVVTAALTLLFASMAAFALSRLQFRGRAAMYLLIIMGLMIPSQVLIVPLFQELRVMQLLNTYWAVILPQIPSVIAVFIFKQFFDGIPKELEDAARVDGAGLWRIYWSVVMPLSRPVTAAVAILTFVWTWNNLLLPLFVLSNPSLMTIPVGLATVQGSFGLRYADIQAGAILAALPLVVLYMFFQRQIVEGVTGSGLKG